MSDVAQALGLKLKAERERRGVSAQKMADDMHLDGWVIEALEAGDYQRIGPAVYAKGHLKKYAALLGVSAVDSSAAPDTKQPPVGAPIPIIRLDQPGSARPLAGPCARGSRGGRGTRGRRRRGCVRGTLLPARRRLRPPTRGRPPRVRPEWSRE